MYFVLSVVLLALSFRECESVNNTQSLASGNNTRALASGNNTRALASGNNTRTIERLYIGLISVTNGQRWGSWGIREMCPLGTYATGFSLKVQSYQGFWWDDTGLNGIALRCSKPIISSSQIVSFSTVQSSTGSWGSWTQNNWCPTGVLKGFQLQVEGDQGLSDDTAANNIRFSCTGNSVLGGSGMNWGTWGYWSSNCGGAGICGIQTKVEAPQGLWDDTSLNNVIFYCCS